MTDSNALLQGGTPKEFLKHLHETTEIAKARAALNKREIKLALEKKRREERLKDAQKDAEDEKRRKPYVEDLIKQVLDNVAAASRKGLTSWDSETGIKVFQPVLETTATHNSSPLSRWASTQPSYVSGQRRGARDPPKYGDFDATDREHIHSTVAKELFCVYGFKDCVMESGNPFTFAAAERKYFVFKVRGIKWDHATVEACPNESNERSGLSGKCAVCFDEDVKLLAFVPCGHTACVGCVPDFLRKQCPVCRQHVRDTQGIFLN